MLELQSNPRGIVLPIRAHAGAKRNAIVGVREGRLRVAVTEAPERGKANRAIVAVLSRALGVPKSSLELISGETSPRKRFLVIGASADAICQSLDSILDAKGSANS